MRLVQFSELIAAALYRKSYAVSTFPTVGVGTVQQTVIEFGVAGVADKVLTVVGALNASTTNARNKITTKTDLFILSSYLKCVGLLGVIVSFLPLMAWIVIATTIINIAVAIIISIVFFNSFTSFIDYFL